MNYAKGIRRARERAALSKRKLAKLSGFDASYIGLLESGKRTPSLDAIETIAMATNVPVGLLMLMCAEKKDLVGIDAKHTGVLAEQLLDLVDAANDD